jgi:integrase
MGRRLGAVGFASDEAASLIVLIELWGCAEVRFGRPNDEALHGHPLHGKGLSGYRAHEVVNSAWIEDAIKINSVHPHHSDVPFRQLHHYALLFHDEMLEALARGIESRLVEGTMRTILAGVADSLVDHRGLTREAYTLDLRQFTPRGRTRSLPLFAVRRADIETFARELEARGRARATVTRRLCTIAGFYKYAVEEELLEHSPAAHVRRPRLDYESHATALDRNELGALLVAAGLGPPPEHALISLLALNGLRVSEATGADIEHLGLERGHRTLVITRKGGKVVTIPLAPRTARAIDLAIGERRRAAVYRRGRAAAGPARRRPDRPQGHPPRPDRQGRQPAHAQTCLHHRRPRRRGAAAGRAGSRLPR